MPALDAYHLDQEDLSAYSGPSCYSYGALSNARWEVMAERLPHVLTHCTVKRYEQRHHLDASHQSEPHRVASALHSLWENTERG